MRKPLPRILTAFAAVFVACLALEGLYRRQIFDTYQAELRAYNSEQLHDSCDRPTLLAMGDSFTAGHGSYAGILQRDLSKWRVIVSAVSGTGVLEATYRAPRRFSRFRPSIFVYQVYVGNDLFDLRHPINWRATSPLRNLYWLFGNYFRVLNFTNYRTRQLLEPANAPADAPDDMARFSVDRYDPRVKTYLHAEPGLIEDSILVQGARRDDYARYTDRLADLLAYCTPGTCRAYVLVVPHVSQVNAEYIGYMTQMGASFTNPAALRQDDYPFVAGLRDRFKGSSNVEVINPLPELRAAQAQKPMYFPNDEHLNAAGQQEIAALLTRRLQLR